MLCFLQAATTAREMEAEGISCVNCKGYLIRDPCAWENVCNDCGLCQGSNVQQTVPNWQWFENYRVASNPQTFEELRATYPYQGFDPMTYFKEKMRCLNGAEAFAVPPPTIEFIRASVGEAPSWASVRAFLYAPHMRHWMIPYRKHTSLIWKILRRQTGYLIPMELVKTLQGAYRHVVKCSVDIPKNRVKMLNFNFLMRCFLRLLQRRTQWCTATGINPTHYLTFFPPLKTKDSQKANERAWCWFCAHTNFEIAR